jgi:hypothetical protein
MRTALERAQPAQMCCWNPQTSFGVIVCIAPSILSGNSGCSPHATLDEAERRERGLSKPVDGVGGQSVAATLSSSHRRRIAGDHFVRSQQYDALHEGLRDENSIERILV